MNYKYTISAAIIGLSIAFLQPQTAKAICSNTQVDATAEKITVLIDSSELKGFPNHDKSSKFVL